MNKIESDNLVMHDTDFNLHEFANKLVAVMRTELKERNQTIELDLSAVYQPYVTGDEKVLEKFFFDLLSNASKYSWNGSRISFSVRELPRIRTGYIHCCFSVETPYIELGLVITRSLVEILNGDIEEKSIPGQRSCFTVTLQLKVREDTEKKVIQNLNPSSIRALIVEYNDINRRSLKRLLKSENIIVEEVMNGQEAVSAFAVQQKGYYDFILMDIQMPVMDVYAAARQIRAMVNHGGDEVVIIAMTADDRKEDVQLAVQAGMNGHLKKPVHFENLKAILAKHS